MKISNNLYSVQQPHTSFKGIHIATSKNIKDGVEGVIDLYKITPKDAEFMKDLRIHTDINKLYPKFTKTIYDNWTQILYRATVQATNTKNTSFIATKNNKPCGIIVMCNKRNSYFLDSICTWPIETGKKVAFAGKTLMKEFLSNFLKSDAKTASLNAITNGPFDVIRKYKHLGFKQIGGENDLVVMELDRDKARNSLNALNELITTTETHNTEDIDLSKKLIL